MMSPSGEEQEFMQFRAPSSGIGSIVLPDEEAEQQAEDEANEHGGDASTEASPIPLEQGSGPGLVNNPILIGLTISGILP